MKAIRNLVGLAALAVCLFIGYRIYQGRAIVPEILAIHDQYEDASSEEDFLEVKRQYEALRRRASGEALDMIEAHIAGCEAWIAFYRTTGRPSVAKYRHAIEKFRAANDYVNKGLLSDSGGVWSANLRTFEDRLREAKGPRDPSAFRAQFERLSAQPFARSRDGLETLFRWKETWERQEAQEGQEAREREWLQETLRANADTFEALRRHLADKYTEIFLEGIAVAKETEITPEEMRLVGSEMEEGPLADKVSALMRPQWDLANVRRFDPDRAEQFAQAHSEELATARRLARRME